MEHLRHLRVSLWQGRVEQRVSHQHAAERLFEGRRAAEYLAVARQRPQPCLAELYRFESFASGCNGSFRACHIRQ